MIDPGQLWLFFVLVFGIIVLPGMDMAFVLGSSLAGGRQRGLAAVAGIVAGGICHVGMTALGLSVLLELIPGAFNAILLGGALYIACIGIAMLRSRAAFGMTAQVRRRSHRATFRQGLLTSLLNPKAYLFMLAIFPQFLRPQHGMLWLQTLIMWLIIAFNQLCIYGGVALMADHARDWLQGKPAASLTASRCVGGVLIMAAAFTGIEGWRMV